MKSKQKIILGFAILFSFGFTQSAFCTLGEKLESTKVSGAKKMSQSMTAYSVQETDLDGITVKEYALPSGVVFGVTWRGIKHPNLSTVLGTYQSEYETLRAKDPKMVGRVPIAVKSSKVSVKMSGHMRDVHGQAYDPSLLPANFSLQDLK